MNSVKSRNKTTRSQSRPKVFKPPQSSSSSFGYHPHAHLIKDTKGSDYLNHENSNEYLLSSFYALVGCSVQVQTVEGATYEGILETISPKLDISLRSVHLQAERKQKKQELCNVPNKENIYKQRTFHFCDIVCINCLNVDIDYAKRDGILTDTSISGNGLVKERELEKWDATEETQTGSSFSLDEADGMSNGWGYEEMVRVNKEKYGVKSTFDSSMSTYMTEIEYKDKEDYLEKELRAQKLVSEIENDVSHKEHDEIDSGISEEDLFSAVVRQDGPGGYQRSHNQPRPRRGMPPRTYPPADHHAYPSNRTMANSLPKRVEGEKPLYSHQLMKSIQQVKTQDHVARPAQASINRAGSPVCQQTAPAPYQQTHAETEEAKVPPGQASSLHPGTYTGGAKPSNILSSGPEPSAQPQATQTLASSDGPDHVSISSQEKATDVSKTFAALSIAEMNGKPSELNSKRRELKECTMKYGKIIQTPKSEPEGHANIDDLRKFGQGFKLPESNKKKKERPKSSESQAGFKSAESPKRSDVQSTQDIPTATSPRQTSNELSEVKAKDSESAPAQDTYEENYSTPPQEREDASTVVEPPVSVVTSEPSLAPPTGSLGTTTKATPSVESQNQGSQPSQPKNDEKQQYEGLSEGQPNAFVECVSKSTLNPNAKDFVPKIRTQATVQQVQPPIASVGHHATFASSPSTMPINAVQAGIIQTNSPSVMNPRPILHQRKRGMMLNNVGENPPGSAMLPGTSVATFFPPHNNQPLMLVQSGIPYAKGQVLPMPMQQAPQMISYVLKPHVNPASGVQPASVGSSGYQENNPPVFIVSQGNQLISPSVITPTQAGYAQSPSSQPGLQHFMVHPPYQQMAGAVPPSQQGGTPGPPQIHRATPNVHPSASQPRHPTSFVLLTQHPNMAMQASPFVAGQPHQPSMQGFQPPS